MTVATAMQGEEEVSPRMACTWENLVQGSSEGAHATSLSLAKASAALTLVAMELHES